ncbi:isocitrate/isopropylmalate family dehydrogenase [uncultured Parolsenella sp.]|uniref:isocitrate/isopropylmalate dehydrogenase family protein n=1 Tax=uncultured Parolsenella sp. TaxID=2083008 RepID=UPI0027D93E75|nr:isocitrate/isopropylmalate family dehydrogenase [uncultured Parolsenella sp.]
MAHEVTLIPGDGIGPEISAAMREVVAATGVDVNWRVQEAGASVMEAEGTPLPERVLDSIRETGTAIKGPVTTPVGSGFRSVNVALRRAFDLYACVRPCLSMPGDGSRYENVDLVIVRENTEDLYAGIEFDEGSEGAAHIIDEVAKAGAGTIRPDSAISLKPISVSGSERIVRYAFDYARRNGRHKVTAVHKANIMKCTDGLFLHVAERVAKDYPDIAFDAKIVDATCMGLVMNPTDFDVMVLPNLYGDIVSDLCAGLVGGLGLAPGSNIGARQAIFEATHGSAPDIAGKDIANPTAMILSAAMMLDHLGEGAAATRVRTAVREVLAEGACVTADIKRALSGSVEGCVGTRAYGSAVADRVALLG